MIFVSAEKSGKNSSRWLPAGDDIDKASPELVKHRIQIGNKTVIEHDCYIEDAVTIGEYVFIGDGVTIGNHSTVACDVAIGPGAIIGHHCIIQQKSFVGRRSKIGEGSLIGPGTEIADDVSLPPYTIAVNRGEIKRSERLTAVVSTARKLETYFGSDAIFVYETTPDLSLENDMEFSEFIKEAHIIKLSDVLKKQEAEQLKKEIIKLAKILRIIAEKK